MVGGDKTGTFIDEWMRDNADLIDEIIRLAAARGMTPYGAAIRAQLDALDTERCPLPGSSGAGGLRLDRRGMATELPPASGPVVTMPPLRDHTLQVPH